MARCHVVWASFWHTLNIALAWYRYHFGINSASYWHQHHFGIIIRIPRWKPVVPMTKMGRRWLKWCTADRAVVSMARTSYWWLECCVADRTVVSTKMECRWLKWCTDDRTVVSTTKRAVSRIEMAGRGAHCCPRWRLAVYTQADLMP